MDVPAFSRLFPTLYHVTFASNLSSIREHGLHSPAALADLYRFSDDERQATLNERRRCIQPLHGITLRDQHAMIESKMKSCLVRITIPEWIALLNTKTFFFLTRDKALTFASTYSAYDSLLLAVDTGALMATHAAHTTLCRINSGSFLYNPRPRGRDSFIPLATYAYKNKRDIPAELTIDVPIPKIVEISTFVLLPAESNPG